MQYFLYGSFIGILVLLAAHAVDFALDAMRRPVAALRAAMPDQQEPIGDSSVPEELMVEYEHAA